MVENTSTSKGSLSAKGSSSTKGFVSTNDFVCGDNNVYHAKQRDDVDFGYSDGQEIERQLQWIFNNVDDLSSTSYELQKHITNWPTEYHLTPKRSNLLRALNLTGVKRVLELGSGCGSISRYLGELGIEVDAVEGSPVRAELAAMRCRDLPGVTISTANFNDVEFPENYYDMVLYVGVTEYAGRFSNGKSDTDALQDLLSLAKRAVTPDGVVMVAIENRTGMKYAMGANEDHYSKPYIGIHNYAQPAGIRTYTRKEWQQQIETAGFAGHEFIYPFPDYKVPTVFLGEDYVNTNPYCYSHLESNRSRDYAKDFLLGSKESLLWETAAASGTLGDYANSFMILMGDSAQTIAAMSEHDFMHLPNYQRKLDYCVSIAKRKGVDCVERALVAAEEAFDPKQQEIASQQGITHRLLKEEPFYTGPLLSIEWMRSLISYHDTVLFEQYLSDYYQYLQGLSKEQRTIDLLPSNIVIIDQKYAVIDEEWLLQDSLSAEFIYYRAVLFFFFSYRDFIEEKLAESKQFETVRDWFYYAFRVVGITLNNEQLSGFYEQNQTFQSAVSFQHGQVNFAEPMIQTPAILSLLWRSDDKEFDHDDFIKVKGQGHSGRQQVVFDFPHTARDMDTLVVFPCSDYRIEKSAFFRMYRLQLLAVTGHDQSSRVVWELADEAEVAEHASFSDMIYENGKIGNGFYLIADSPRLEWRIEQDLDLHVNETLQLKIEMQYLRSEQYLHMKDKYLSKLAHFEYQERVMRAQVDELALIKRSRAWALSQRISGLAQEFKATTQKIKANTIGRLQQKKNATINESVGSKLTEPRARALPTTLSSLLAVKDGVFAGGDWKQVADLPQTPSLSVLVYIDAACTPSRLKLFLQQLTRQDYPHLELLLVCEVAQEAQAAAILDQSGKHYQLFARETLSVAAGDVRSSYHYLEQQATGDYLLILQSSDILLQHALTEWMYTLLQVNAKWAYADEAYCYAGKTALEYRFKPGYSPETHASTAYIGHAILLKRCLWHTAGGLPESPDLWQDWVFELAKCAPAVAHCRRPLSINQQLNPLSTALKSETVAMDDAATTPLISIIIPFRDYTQLLSQCLQSIVEHSSYENYEIIGVSNDSLTPSVYALMNDWSERDSRVRFVEHNIEFNFSALVNFGVSQARGDTVVLLNNDIEIISHDWLQQLYRHAEQDHVGAVGGQLLFPDGSLQHVGIHLGGDGLPVHSYKQSPADIDGYFQRVSAVNNVAAVTGAMMMVKKAHYEQLNGFDENDFAVAFNDVDFCLRLMQLGLHNVYTPHAVATHHESISRGYETTPERATRFLQEQARFLSHHKALIESGDPYFNPNLQQDRHDFVV